MPFYFAFQNRRRKVKRNLVLGNKTKKKSRKSGGFDNSQWSGIGVNELAAYENSTLSVARRLSLESSVLDGSRGISPLSQELETVPGSPTYESGPPKPPRLMEKKLFTCENPECNRTEELLGMIAINFKACPACFTHYCSTKCRVAHWPLHKMVCHYGRMKSYMKIIGELCKSCEDVQSQLSSLATAGFYTKGRGCVMLVFASANDARLFIDEKIGQKPTYSSLEQIETLGVRSEHRKNLVRIINHYKPDCEFVLNVAIVAERNMPASPAVPRNKDPSLIEQFVIPLNGKKETSLSKAYRRLTL
ncbi:apical junction component 1 homolog [Dendronephthya gigantea]|uniref:apical junction component 1 homolog n=1 Tax=Dendronephthya gigantea TaxID=151771 RepID=UPI00106B1BA5|nr:apical junction component 1 homolog [Dendronephthya gigantea]